MKVPEPRKLPSGSYNIHLRLGGESISITHPTAAECRAEARLTKAEYLAGKRKAATRTAKETTLKQAEEAYIEKSTPVLSPSTIRGYKAHKNSRFKDYQDKALKDIDFQKMINDELGKVSPKTVRSAWGLVHASLKLAGYPIPEVRLAPVPIKEISFLRPDEILKFCEAIKGRSYEVPCLLMLHGLRLSEMKALTIDSIDTKEMTITVSGAIVKGPDGYVRKETNKNKTSTRKVPILIPRLCEAVKGPTFDFSSAVGISSSVLLRDVKRACERAGVRVVSNHGLRHSWVSLLWALKIDQVTCMKWGGWSDIQTMHKIYVRLSEAGETESAKTVRAFFEPDQNANENANKKKRRRKQWPV